MRLSKQQIISASVTTLVVVIVLLILFFSKIFYSSVTLPQWPPRDSSEFLFAGEYVMVGETPFAANDNSSSASADNLAAEATDLADQGSAADPAPIVSSTRESDAKVAPKPRQEQTGPTAEQLEQQRQLAQQRAAAEEIKNRVKFGSGSGNQSGATQGSPAGNSDSGALEGQPGASLGGRTLEYFPKPKGSEVGTIEVSVVVDRRGNVISARHIGGSGPVNRSTTAINNCVIAARNSRFSVDNSAPNSQQGVITYRFR